MKKKIIIILILVVVVPIIWITYHDLFDSPAARAKRSEMVVFGKCQAQHDHMFLVIEEIWKDSNKPNHPTLGNRTLLLPFISKGSVPPDAAIAFMDSRDFSVHTVVGVHSDRVGVEHMTVAQYKTACEL